MHQVQKVVALLAEQLSTPRSLAVKLLFENGEIAQLQELRAEPSGYSTAEDYHRDVIITDFLRKLCLPGDAERRRQAAIDGFLACEKRNWSTNRRLYRFIDNHSLTVHDLPVQQFITAWRKEVAGCLLALPNTLTPQFSGGSTVSDRGWYTTIPDKITACPTFYPESRGLLSLWWETAWGRACAQPSSDRAHVHPRVVRSNRFFTVPKDGKTDRGCCMEASLSLSYQLAVGKLIRSRLRDAYGIDLQHAQVYHRKLAQKASIDGSLATIDLSNASNMLARALPELVLPNQWYQLVDSLRAPNVDIDGRIQRLEMFSSMGNGFTFELETLLFLTLARTVAKMSGFEYLVDHISVFGDDIVVPTEICHDVLAALTYFGFEPNKRKTFVTGLFRESCGGDYFNGEPVRAHYLKSLPDEPQHWISLANGLWRLPQKWVSRARMECLKNIPSAVRSCQGPEALGDTVIHGPPEYWTTKSLRPSGEFEPVVHYRAYTPMHDPLPWQHWWPEVILASALAGVGEDGPVPRNAVSGYRVTWVPAPGNSWLPCA